MEDTAKYCKKRTKAQIAADTAFIEEQATWGKMQEEIALELSARRPYSLSRQQIQKDIAKLKRKWDAASIQMRSAAKAKMLASLAAQESELWDAWFESKTDSVKKLVEAVGPATMETGERIAPADRLVRKIVVTETRCGDASYMRSILNIQERRAKLLGLYEPRSQEFRMQPALTEAEKPVDSGLSSDEKDELILRHYERILRKKAVEAEVIKSASATQLPVTSGSLSSAARLDDSSTRV